MIHPDTELRVVDEEIGLGVFATKLIPKGTVTLALDSLDQIFEPSYLNSLDPLRSAPFEKYTYRDQEGRYILSWDHGKYVNHSFHANCFTTPYGFDIAVRDIHAGEQLTNEYGLFNLDEPFLCRPEEGSERTSVSKADLIKYYPEWDAKILDAFKAFEQVSQPLDLFIPKECRKRIRVAVKENRVVDSVLALYYGGE
ncbi:SET domain-containing protein [Bacillus sp. B-jedd]|uniref:SET domain-containing protein n=1 Tax=Bacillus sp. B-jedd TaxID=1476857 RepID=UPI0005155591|nr:SET domain-containing protein [Bacillus sp. B-jedd]CEG29309.1 SET domain protein [Bacillus sp. B-jedd]